MKRKFFFVILSIFLFVLIIEVIFTLFFVYRQNYYGPLAKFTLREENKIIEFRIPHNKSTGLMKPGEHIYKNNTIKINSKGYRGDEFNIKNNSNCRFLALGGSTTLGINSQKPWPEILQNKLRKNFDNNCEVINTGILGASLNDIENLFFSNLKNYKPNYIILLSNHNSAHYDSYAKGHKKPNIIDNELSYKLFKINNFLFSNLMTYRFLDLSYKRLIWFFSKNKNELIRNPNNKNIFHSPNYFETNYRVQIENLVLFSKRNNIKVILIKQPRNFETEIYNELQKKNIQELLEDFIVYKNFSNGNEKNDREKFDIYSNIILNKNLELIKNKYKEIELVDPVNEFLSKKRIKKNFLDDDLHYTQEGNYLMAEEIYKKILKYFNK